MTLTVPTSLKLRLGNAAYEGLDVVYVAIIYFGGVVGTRYYSTRPIPGMSPGWPWEDKLMAIPEVPKRSDPSSVRFDALNDDLVLRIRNTPEKYDGTYDDLVLGDYTQRGRFQDLLTQQHAAGCRVEVGVAESRNLTSINQFKWDGIYKIDRVERNNKEAVLYCVDRLLHPGEKLIGSTVNDGDWPAAPEESYGAVRGPVFGKVDALPLVPVDVGMHAALASEIDAQDRVIYISGRELGMWPASGYVEIGDEIIYYPVIDRELGRLGSAESPCSRGVGFPNTTPAVHGPFSLVKELFTGREGLTGNGTVQPGIVSIPLSDASNFPNFGIIMINNEAMAYSSKGGNTLNGVIRGVAVPTIAKVHDIGSPVRTIPVGPDGKPRYRYLVGEGHCNWAGNLRVKDEEGNDLPYSGGAATLSQVAMASGKNWSVLDLPARPRFEKFENSGSQIPQEWICQTDGRVDGEGVALAASFLRWKVLPITSTPHLETWPRAIDPNASTRAVILQATSGQNFLALEFNAKWDSGLNSPRRRYGRFRDARLRVRVQYDRQTAVVPTFAIQSNTVLVKTGSFFPPTVGGGVGGGAVVGTQQLPQSRWGTQNQTVDVNLGLRDTNTITNASSGYWINPMTTTGPISNGSVDQGAVTSGDTRMFLSGGWLFPASSASFWGGAAMPMTRTLFYDGIQQKDVLTGFNPSQVGTLNLCSNNSFPTPDSRDRLKALIVTVYNPSSTQQAFKDLVWTGWTGYISAYTGPDGSGTVAGTLQVGISKFEGKKTHRISLEGWTWAQLQSLKVSINPYTGTQGAGSKGATVGQIFISVEYEPDVEGQRVGTLVEGSYFRTTATTTPSAIFDQTVSLGALAKDLGRQFGTDPWNFFTALNQQGLALTIGLPTAGDGVQFAVADVVLEIEYDALSVMYDGQVLADVDGRIGTPVGGGATQVLENPVDLLSYLTRESEFYNVPSADLDSTSFAASRALAAAVGWKCARAIVEQVTVRDLVTSLAAENRLLLLADGLKMYCKVKFEESQASDAVRTVGDQSDPALALVTDEVQIVNRLEDVHNSIGFYYRRNYANMNFRAVIEEEDPESIRLYDKKRAVIDLHWHQSSRGYAGGQPEQKARLVALTGYTLARAARIWDYATVELSAAGAEDLQRNDVVVLNRPRSGYYETPGRVVFIQRRERPMKWLVTLEMNPSTLGYIWQSAVDPRTYIKLAEAGSRMDFVIRGVLHAQLTSAGHFRCRGGLSISATSTISTTKADTGDDIYLYRDRRDGAFNGKVELMMHIGDLGDVTIYSFHNGTVNAQRNLAAPGTVLNLGGVGGIVQTGAGATMSTLEFYLANRLTMVLDSWGMTLRGSVRANLGIRMGSEG